MTKRLERDAYYTPLQLARFAVDWMLSKGYVGAEDTWWDPHAGSGVFVDACTERGLAVGGSDICVVRDVIDDRFVDRLDFLAWPDTMRPDWIVGNPPYTNVEAHLRQALRVAVKGVCFVLKVSHLESNGRAAFWAEHPPCHVAFLSQRPSFMGGGGSDCKTAFMLCFWVAGHPGPTFSGEVVSWR